MMLPSGGTPTLSFAGGLKWLLIIASMPCLLKGCQGIVERDTVTGYGGLGAAESKSVTGSEAVRYGLLNLAVAAALFLAAWAVWYFWQRNED